MSDRDGYREERRRARLRDELLDAGLEVRLEHADALLEEVAHALWAGVHEQQRLGYGAVITDRGLSPSVLGDRIASRSHDLDELRRLADGVETFVLRRQGHPPEVVVLPRPDEARLVTLQRRHDVTIVRRSTDGVVTIVTVDQVAVRRQGAWALRPHGAAIADRVHAMLRVGDPDVLRRLLDVCLHVLSPRRVGTALVWFLVPFDSSRLTEPGAPLPAELDLEDPQHQAALAKRLAMTDGACIVESDGTVSRVGAYLRWSPEAEQHIHPEVGLRHASARWYSFDTPDAVVITVSHDGPVTVYADGSVVLRADYSDPSTWQDYVPAHTEEPVEEEHHDCASCGKPLRIERYASATPPATADARCPVCAQPLPDVLTHERDRTAVTVAKPLLVDRAQRRAS